MRIAGSALAGVVVVFFGISCIRAQAEQLSKTGTAEMHSAFIGVGTSTEVDDNRVHWVGTYWGHSFNDAGNGFLHDAVWNCPAASDIADGIVSFKGYCTVTDTDGDKVFGEWSGGGPMTGEITGRVDFTGGTGKYSGIQGEWDFKCRAIGNDNQLSCTQQTSYELP